MDSLNQQICMRSVFMRFLDVLWTLLFLFYSSNHFKFSFIFLFFKFINNKSQQILQYFYLYWDGHGSLWLVYNRSDIRNSLSKMMPPTNNISFQKRFIVLCSNIASSHSWQIIEAFFFNYSLCHTKSSGGKMLCMPWGALWRLGEFWSWELGYFTKECVVKGGMGPIFDHTEK